MKEQRPEGHVIHVRWKAQKDTEIYEGISPPRAHYLPCCTGINPNPNTTNHAETPTHKGLERETKRHASGHVIP